MLQQSALTLEVLVSCVTLFWELLEQILLLILTWKGPLYPETAEKSLLLSIKNAVLLQWMSVAETKWHALCPIPWAAFRSSRSCQYAAIQWWRGFAPGYISRCPLLLQRGHSELFFTLWDSWQSPLNPAVRIICSLVQKQLCLIMGHFCASVTVEMENRGSSKLHMLLISNCQWACELELNIHSEHWKKLGFWKAHVDFWRE